MNNIYEGPGEETLHEVLALLANVQAFFYTSETSEDQALNSLADAVNILREYI